MRGPNQDAREARWLEADTKFEKHADYLPVEEGEEICSKFMTVSSAMLTCHLVKHCVGFACAADDGGQPLWIRFMRRWNFRKSDQSVTAYRLRVFDAPAAPMTLAEARRSDEEHYHEDVSTISEQDPFEQDLSVDETSEEEASEEEACEEEACEGVAENLVNLLLEQILQQQEEATKALECMRADILRLSEKVLQCATQADLKAAVKATAAPPPEGQQAKANAKAKAKGKAAPAAASVLRAKAQRNDAQQHPTSDEEWLTQRATRRAHGEQDTARISDEYVNADFVESDAEDAMNNDVVCLDDIYECRGPNEDDPHDEETCLVRSRGQKRNDRKRAKRRREINQGNETLSLSHISRGKQLFPFFQDVLAGNERLSVSQMSCGKQLFQRIQDVPAGNGMSSVSQMSEDAKHERGDSEVPVSFRRSAEVQKALRRQHLPPKARPDISIRLVRFHTRRLA